LLVILLSILLSCTIVIVIVILLVSPARSRGWGLSVVILCSWGRVIIVSFLFIVCRGCCCYWIFIIICLIISISIILIVIMIIISISIANIISWRCSISLLLCCTLLILSHSFTDHSFIDLFLSLDSFNSFINIISHLRVFLLFFF
jgi:hypothetical protein